MAERVKVTIVNVYPTEDYAGRQPEEGYPMYRRVWDVVVYTDLNSPRCETYVYELAFPDVDEANRFADLVRAKGDIDPEHWTYATPPAVPEWATPEFAWRERMGLPL